MKSARVAPIMVKSDTEEGAGAVETYTRDEFRALLLRAIEDTRSMAQVDVAEPLPVENLLVLEAFSQGLRESSVDEILTWLYRDGTFPRVVVMSVNGIVDGKTKVRIAPSGHAYVRDRALTWNEPPDLGPFHCVGLMLGRAIWQRPRPFSARDLEESTARWRALRTS